MKLLPYILLLLFSTGCISTNGSDGDCAQTCRRTRAHCQGQCRDMHHIRIMPQSDDRHATQQLNYNDMQDLNRCMERCDTQYTQCQERCDRDDMLPLQDSI